jgi:hypothetical protein
MPAWQLRFDPKEIHALAALYVAELPQTDPKKTEERAIRIGEHAHEEGSLDREGFLAVCYWKTPRSKPRCERNSADVVVEATRIALSTSAEELRVGVLQCLDGVGLSTASAILHLCHRDRYPLLDFRALWSWGFDVEPSHTHELWMDYVHQCRRLAQEQGVDMRTLDRALWQYAKNH